MMELNKKELRMISYDFNRIANRLLRVSSDDSTSVLRLFINFIENTSIIYDYIKTCLREDIDINDEVKDVINGHGSMIFDLGNNDNEEVFTIYHIFKNMIENNINMINLARSYSHQTNYDAMVKDFNQRISLVLINHIEAYLTKISIEMGFNEETKYLITVNGGQVNISQDQSTINAVQNNGINVDELNKIIESIKSSLTEGIPVEIKDEIIDYIDVIGEEMPKQNPKKAFISTAYKGLENIMPKVERFIGLSASILTIIQFLQPFINKILT